MNRKIGRSGGVSGDRGMVSTKVAMRRQISISPKLAETANSDQRRRRNLEGGVILI